MGYVVTMLCPCCVHFRHVSGLFVVVFLIFFWPCHAFSILWPFLARNSKVWWMMLCSSGMVIQMYPFIPRCGSQVAKSAGTVRCPLRAHFPLSIVWLVDGVQAIVSFGRSDASGFKRRESQKRKALYDILYEFVLLQ